MSALLAEGGRSERVVHQSSQSGVCPQEADAPAEVAIVPVSGSWLRRLGALLRAMRGPDSWLHIGLEECMSAQDPDPFLGRHLALHWQGKGPHEIGALSTYQRQGKTGRLRSPSRGGVRLAVGRPIAGIETAVVPALAAVTTALEPTLHAGPHPDILLPGFPLRDGAG